MLSIKVVPIAYFANVESSSVQSETATQGVTKPLSQERVEIGGALRAGKLFVEGSVVSVDSL